MSGMVEVSWFFLDAEAFATDGLSRVVDVIASNLPKALPRRYGLFEPPQYKLEREGLEHFKTFIAGHVREGAVWYCSKPCDFVFISVPDQVGPTPRGFRCARVSLEFDAGALRMPGWSIDLSRTWLAIAEIVGAFYAEIRSEECPTSSWWWNGIPRKPASAMLIGAPYLDHWPEFTRSARQSGRFSYIDCIGNSMAPVPLAPPLSIAQPPETRVELDPVTGQVLAEIRSSDLRYPEIWPFDGPVRRSLL